MPYPNQENRQLYREKSITEIVKLLNLTQGKTLILFTAKEDMEYVYKKLSNKHLPYKILMQGKGSSQARQLDKFKSDIDSVILGTGTYWEGINVEGEALSQVIIFGYRMSDDGKPYIIEKEADTVRRIYKMFIDGMSLQAIADTLEAEGIKRRNGQTTWNKGNVRAILKNEKYVGDAVLQKTYTKDCITHKRVINYGDKAKYLIHDCHEPIIDRDTYNLAMQEMAKRSSMSQKSTKAKTEQGKYSGIYALSELMICGECGSPYRRVTWNSHGHKLIVWRCINRLDHGTKYCKCSPSINEEKLQAAIVTSLNQIYSGRSELISIMEQNLDCVLTEEDELGQAISKMGNRIKEIEKARDNLVTLVTTGAIDIDASDDKFKALKSEEEYLREQITIIQSKTESKDELRLMIQTITDELEKYSDSLITYSDIAVRKIIDCIKVLSKTEIEITFKGGFEMKVSVEK